MNKVVKIGGKDRPLNFGRSFWREVEKITGKMTAELLDIRELMSVNNQTAIAYASLKWGMYANDGLEPVPSFTLTKIDDWLDERPEAMKEIYDAMTESLPQPKKASAAEVPQ